MFNLCYLYSLVKIGRQLQTHGSDVCSIEFLHVIYTSRCVHRTLVDICVGVADGDETATSASAADRLVRFPKVGALCLSDYN